MFTFGTTSRFSVNKPVNWFVDCTGAGLHSNIATRHLSFATKCASSVNCVVMSMRNFQITSQEYKLVVQGFVS